MLVCVRVRQRCRGVRGGWRRPSILFEWGSGRPRRPPPHTSQLWPLRRGVAMPYSPPGWLPSNGVRTFAPPRGGSSRRPFPARGATVCRAQRPPPGGPGGEGRGRATATAKSQLAGGCRSDRRERRVLGLTARSLFEPSGRVRLYGGGRGEMHARSVSRTRHHQLPFYWRPKAPVLPTSLEHLRTG